MESVFAVMENLATCLGKVRSNNLKLKKKWHVSNLFKYLIFQTRGAGASSILFDGLKLRVHEVWESRLTVHLIRLQAVINDDNHIPKLSTLMERNADSVPYFSMDRSRHIVERSCTSDATLCFVSCRLHILRKVSITQL